MFNDHWYNESTRRTVSVFGSLFNNITVVKTDAAGKILQDIKVPLAYGPRQKFLARTKNLGESKMAIKLPRMSFEITDMSYDGAARINKTKKYSFADDVDNPYHRKSLKSPSVYKVGIELNIMAKAQDDALQILEQILPVFQPDYTVTITDIPELELKADVPIVLTGVTLNDEYEGDFLSRRTIVYTLTFETRIRYYRGIHEQGIIKYTDANINTGGDTIESISIDGTTLPYTETIDFFEDDTEIVPVDDDGNVVVLNEDEFITFYEQNTAPGPPVAGTMWYDTVTDILYIYISGAWVQVNG